MMTSKKRIQALEAQQAAQAGQINRLSKAILSLSAACAVSAISAARANKKAKGLEVKINGVVVEEGGKKKEHAPIPPKAPQAQGPNCFDGFHGKSEREQRVAPQPQTSQENCFDEFYEDSEE